MRVSAKVDYAMRAAIELAAAQDADADAKDSASMPNRDADAKDSASMPNRDADAKDSASMPNPSGGRPVTADVLARAQDIPVKFLENILQGLRQGGVVQSRRGADGGHLLARPANEITLADVIRAIDGPLAAVGGRFPEELRYTGTAEPLLDVWIAVRVSLRRVLEEVTLADVAAGDIPSQVAALTDDPGAWAKR